MTIDWLGLSKEFGTSFGKHAAQIALAKILGEEEITQAVQDYVAGCDGSELIWCVLRLLKPEAARSECLLTVRTSSNQEARRAAAELFRVVANRSSLPVVREFLADGETSIQVCGAWVVDYLVLDGECRDLEDLGPYLAEMSSHPNPSVNEEARQVLESLSLIQRRS